MQSPISEVYFIDALVLNFNCNFFIVLYLAVALVVK